MAKLGGTTELFGPLSGDRRLFFVSQEGASCETKALRAGCALCAMEVWLLRQPRSSAGVRLTGLHSQEGASCETKALRAGCALCAMEVWLLRQPRSGAGVR
ncbi:hypothetical protein [Hungatella effluvii]|uniref:hypothetical protein n=1 Tax=Hungatella effluvii TaxID=1096246 RepID=UPI0022E41356|nr:hypothetical protein [Hungatella effluvii]